MVVHNVGSSTPLWTYDYPLSSGTYQESAHDIDITDDGKYFIIGSLGDFENLNPEVNIFHRDSAPYLYYSVDMPGSVFSVDIMSDGSYATTCGKHVHANQMGRGGDIVLIDTDITGISNHGDAHLVPEFMLFGNYPNPFSEKTEINYTIRDSGYGIRDMNDTEIKIYDATGHLVKNFPVQLSPIGHQSFVTWYGRDNQNRQLPGGVYFIQLETPNHKETKKTILLR